ncbi:MAG: beta-lactamase family protein [Ignavibacteria bacterium]|nr:beta-lactamase family protein [Ignavibacteria bacterium]
MKILRYILTVLLFTNIAFSQDLEAKLTEIIKPLLDGKKNMSMAVGLYDVNSETPRMFFFGKVSKEDSSKPDEYTVYEIGSITKTFTTTMLVMLERDGKLKINDPVQNYLPEGTTIHNFSSTAPVKLYNLATQTSGLPRLPSNMVMNKNVDVNNPYKKYSEADLLSFINNYIPEYEPGTKYLYSNAGMGILGFAMERASGKSYEELLHYYLVDSLGMTMTSIIINADMQKKLAKPYNEKGEPAFNWDFDVMEGAGAIKSNLSDMIKYLAFQMGKTEKLEFKEGLKLMQTRRFETDIPNTAIGLAWHISETMWDRTVIWHNGGTGGYRSFMGFIPETNTGVVVLSNQANDVDGVAMEILKYLNR